MTLLNERIKNCSSNENDTYINLKKELNTIIFKIIPTRQIIDQDILKQIKNIMNIDSDFKILYDNFNNNT